MKITLCDPNVNPQSAIQNYLLVNVKYLSIVNRESIISYLRKHQHIPAEAKVALQTFQPSNYLLDCLLEQNVTLPWEWQSEDAQETVQKRGTVELPIHLRVVLLTNEYDISSTTNVSLDHFEVEEKIGEGTYSEIFLVRQKQNRKHFTMKRINRAECKSKGSLDMIHREVQVLQLSSRWNVKLYYCFEDLRYTYMVLDYCPFGDLFGVLRSHKKLPEMQRMSIVQKYLIWIQIALGIVGLHMRGYIYRDLKPENVLIDLKGEVKLCDFGFARKIAEGEKLHELCGSYEYVAPELLKSEGYDRTLDLYCLGLLLYQIMVGRNPFEGITPATIDEIKTRPVLIEKKALYPNTRDLIKKLMAQNPQDRLGARNSLEIFGHEFFKENEDLMLGIFRHERSVLKHLRFAMPEKLQPRQELEKLQAKAFDFQCFNYLTPNFDVTENEGPKFSFNF